MLAPHFCSIIRHSAWNIAPRLLHLGEEALGELGVRNVVYLARSRIENAQLIARQVKATNQCAPPRAAPSGPAPGASSCRAAVFLLCVAKLGRVNRGTMTWT